MTNGPDKYVSLNISDFVDAVEREIREFQMAHPASFKLHPEDYAILKQQAGKYMPYPSLAENQFAGLKIIIDSTAPRLPRR